MNFWRYLALGWRVDLRGWLWTWALCLILVWGLGVLGLMEWVVWTVPDRLDPALPPPGPSKVFFPAPSKARLVLSYVPKAQFSVHTRTMENEATVAYAEALAAIPENVYAFTHTATAAEELARSLNAAKDTKRGKFIAGSFTVDLNIEGRCPAVVGTLAGMSPAILNAGIAAAQDCLARARKAVGEGDRANALYWLKRAAGGTKRALKDLEGGL